MPKRGFKFLLPFLVFLFVLLSPEKVLGATKYWIGPSGGSFNDNANWSTSSGGTNDTTAPGTSDMATFTSADTDNVALDSTVSVQGINIQSGYSGSLIQSGGVNVSVSTTFTQADGVYTGSSGLITITGTFTLSNGTFTASTATTSFRGSFTKSGGTFNHNSGIVAFYNLATGAGTISGSDITFNNFVFHNDIVTGTTILTISSSFTVNGYLKIYSTYTSSSGELNIKSSGNTNPTITIAGNLEFPNTGSTLITRTLGSGAVSERVTINLQGDLVMAITSARILIAPIVFTGTGDQIINKSVAAYASTTMSSTKVSGTLNVTSYVVHGSDHVQWTAGSITIGSAAVLYTLTVAGGTVTMANGSTVYNSLNLWNGTLEASSGTTTLRGSFTKIGGTLNTNNGTIAFYNLATGAGTISGSDITFNNLVFYNDTTTSATALTVSNSFTVNGYFRIYSSHGSATGELNVKSSGSANPTITVVGNLEFPNTGHSSTNRTIGSTLLSERLTLNLQGDLVMSIAGARILVAPVVFTGTGTQVINKSAGYASTTMSSTKESGTLNFSTYTVHSSDHVQWTSGSVTANTGTVFQLLTVGGGTFTASGLVTITSNFLITGGTFTASTATTTFRANFTKTGGTFDANNGIVAFYNLPTAAGTISGSDITFNNFVFYNDTVTSTTILTVSNSFTVNGYFRIYSSYSPGGTGELNIKSSGNANPTITVVGNLDMLNTGNTGTNRTIGSNATSERLTFNLQGDLIMSIASARILIAPIVFTGTGTQVINKTAGYASTTMSSTKSSGTLNITNYTTHASDHLQWTAGSVTVDGGANFQLLTVGGGTFTMSGQNTVTGNFLLGGGTFVGSTATTSFRANFTRTAGSLDANNGTIAFYNLASGSGTITGTGLTFYNFVFHNDTSTSQTILTIDNDITIGGYLRIYSTYGGGTGELTLRSRNDTNPTITVTGNVEIPGVGHTGTARTLGSTVNAHRFTVNVSGDYNVNTSAATVYVPFIFSGSGNQTLTKSAGTFAASSTWTINKSGGVASLGSTVAHPSTTTVQEGIFNLNGNSFTATTVFTIEDGGTLRLQGGESSLTSPTFGSGSTTVEYTGSSSYTGLKAGNSYYNLLFNGSGTWTLNSALDVDSNLEIANGTLATGGNAITLAGNWTNGGTFTHGNGTVTFDGTNQSILGSVGTTFYNFIKAVTSARTLTFPTSVTTTISNNTTLTGQSGALLSLRSSSSGSQSSVNISNSGTRSISYVDVKDQNNTNATAVLCISNCTNSFNNTNWIFFMLITTDAASAVGAEEATLNATIVDNGGSNATQSGFAYGTAATLSTVIATSTLGSQSGNIAFDEDIDGLTCGTTYYFRAYVTNSAGTTLGDIESFTTLTCDAPTVTSDTSANLTTTAADIGGSITNTGNLTGLEHGFAYGTTESLSTVLATSTLGAYSGTGSFSESLSGLTCNTSYYFRAYATNAQGTGFGAIKTFTTSACATNSGSSGSSSSSGGRSSLPPQSQSPTKNPTKSPSPSPSPSPTYSPLPNTLNVIPYPIKPDQSSTTLSLATTSEDTSTTTILIITPVIDLISDVVSAVIEFASSAVTSTFAIITSVGGSISSGVVRTIRFIATETLDIPAADTIVQTIVGSGMVVGVVTGSIGVTTGGISVSDVLLHINRLWGVTLTGLGFRRRNPKWGVVYDSKSMQPVDPALVTVYDLSGKEVASAITDLDGRFGFLLAPGTYTIAAAKTNYIFPSKALSGKSSDGLHENLYFGEQFTVTSNDSVIKYNIPMDSQGFDWNEYIKHEQRLTEFYEPHDRLIKKISYTLFSFGFILSLFLLALNPGLMNSIVFIIYALSGVILILSRRVRPFGYVSSGNDHHKLANARINIYSGETLIAQKTTDQYGRYYCLVPKGTYHVTVETENKGVYTLVKDLERVKVRNGIIKKDIEI